MIEFLTGLPRSGKTYRAVYDIKNKFMNADHAEFNKHRYLYTNIGGLKFDDIQLHLECHPVETEDDIYTKKVYPLDWKKLKHHLDHMYKMSQEEKPDSEIIDYAIKYKLSPAKFVIDESYKYFKKKVYDDVLIWWMAYHGHLGHDLVLIVQNKKMLHADYKMNSENFVHALPKSKTISNKSFKYYHYADESYDKDQRYDTSRLSVNQEIFDLYKSGDMHNPKKVVHKFIGIGIGAFLLSGFLFYRLIDSVGGSESKEVSQSIPRSSENVNHYSSSTDLYQIRCDYDSCWLKDNDYDLFSYPLNYFKQVIYENEITFLYSDTPVSFSRISYSSTYQVKTLVESMSDYYYEMDDSVIRHYFPQWFNKLEATSRSVIASDFSSINTPSSNGRSAPASDVGDRKI